MRIKNQDLWVIPTTSRVKHSAGWKPVLQVFNKVQGVWFKTADYNPTLFFDVYCNTPNTGINSYAYETLWKGAFTVQPGDTFEYEMFSTSTHAALDIDFGVDAMRHFEIFDQSGRSVHPSSTITEQLTRWTRRVFTLDKVAGLIGTSIACCIEDDVPGWRHLYVRNILLKDRHGVVKADFLRHPGFFPQHESWVKGGAGYANYIFQTKHLYPAANFD